MKVFISSTYVDLIEYREAAIKVVNRYEGTPLAMELFMSRPEEPVTVCNKEIEKCDIFIGIYAHRFGTVPKGQDKSITQMEYELAKKLGKDCLCFIVDKKFPWVPDLVEHEKKEELKAFLDKVKEKHALTFFTTPDDFAIKLSTSLGKLLSSKKEKVPPDTFIPLEPYIAHPYPLEANFTGRGDEMEMLTNWFSNDEKPVLVLEAIGGMGKSALSWVWLNQHLPASPVEVAGVFWWSFYNAPFDTFLQELACYVTGEERMDDHVLSRFQTSLQNRRFLLVLDGLERVLRGYAGMEAMFIQEKRFQGDPEVVAEWDRRMREPVDAAAERFLKALSTGKTRTLITTRLMPSPLEDLAGVKREFLKGLSRTDTVDFLRKEGVKGTRAELEEAGQVYDFHPLMLRLLAGSIKRSRTKDIAEAFSTNFIHRKEPHKILSTAFNLLSEDEHRVATHAAALRRAFTLEAAEALLPGMNANKLWEVMQELRGLGVLFYDETADRFDFHPIMRSFLYDQLTSEGDAGEQVHTLAVEYFQAMPKSEKVITLEDLAPVIELYHHLIKAGNLDEASQLYQDRIGDPIYYQLSAYHLNIELLKELFPEGDHGNCLPRLEKELDQACVLGDLGNIYTLSGQPAKAVPLYLLHNKLVEKNDDKKNLVIGLGEAADVAQSIGQFSAFTVHLRKNIALCAGSEIEDEFLEAFCHMRLGRVLAFQVREKGAEEELDIALKLFEKGNKVQSLSVVSDYRSLSALLQARLAAVQGVPVGKENQTFGQSREALKQARRALAFAEKTVETRVPVPRDFVQAYWLLGEVLIQCSLLRSPNSTSDSFEIQFYDEYFQQQTHAVGVETGHELAAAERCLHEALRRCRKANMVDMEPDILLTLARLDRAKHGGQRPPDLTHLTEAMEIAQRAGYRLVLADLHLFCGEVLLSEGGSPAATLLGFTAAEHLTKTKYYALDVSEFSHLYQSSNPDFYNGIPEYEMLQRGMTEKERRENGYWVAYRIAEELEKKIKD